MPLASPWSSSPVLGSAWDLARFGAGRAGRACVWGFSEWQPDVSVLQLLLFSNILQYAFCSFLGRIFLYFFPQKFVCSHEESNFTIGFQIKNE